MKKAFIPKVIILTLSVCAAAFVFSSCKKECLHIAMTESVIAPTCDIQGKTVHTCPDCGYTYDSTFTAPLGHTLKTEVHEADCDEQGYTQSSCECGYTFTSDYITPPGHDLEVTETLPTCNTEGFKTARCRVCDYNYIYDLTAPTGHDLRAEVTYVATCKQNGSTTYVCDCGFTYVGDYRFYSDIFKGAYVDNTAVLAKGLDTSKHNHNIDTKGNYIPLDWTAIKSAGFDFAILRAGYIGVKDPAFEMDYADARAAGLDLGVYFYTYADSVEEARAEAMYLLDIIEGKSFEYPIYFDIEEPRLEALGKETLTNICIEFISVLQENGYYGALYSNNNWLNNLLDTAKMTTLFDIWYARYPTLTGVLNDAVWNTDKYGKQMAMWQFSKTGTVNGIVNAKGESIMFDLNYAYKDYPSIIKELGYNNLNNI